jgi:hypothetical protein
MFTQELQLAHESVEESGDFESVLTAIDADWIEESLLATNKASVRNRRLPAQLMLEKSH